MVGIGAAAGTEAPVVAGMEDKRRAFSDPWYKAVAYFGLVLFIVGLTVGIPGLSRKEALFISAGFFFIGAGVWRRRLGITFEPRPLGLVGVLLIGVGVWDIVKRLWL